MQWWYWRTSLQSPLEHCIRMTRLFLSEDKSFHGITCKNRRRERVREWLN
jgi:hypothetical protein